MFCYLLFLLLLSKASCIVKPGPLYPPTKGEIWPRPQNQTKSNDYFTLSVDNFTIEITGKTCPILKSGTLRYKNTISDMYQLLEQTVNKPRIKKKNFPKKTNRPRVASKDKHFNKKMGPKHRRARSDVVAAGTHLGEITQLQVHMSTPCESYPHLDMDESYELEVASPAMLRSQSVWGILRGLESFTQMLYFNDEYTEIRINSSKIHDFPRYPHRGLLLDTSRHYISLNIILIIIKTMAINKMNVFHWHIVDDQSFPYVSGVYPELSSKGAFRKHAVYTPKDVKKVVEYARFRGVRVIPEFDVPGHTRSWGVSHPELLTNCYVNNNIEGLGPMDPVKADTYHFIKVLYEEVATLFPDTYVHIGGDEVEHSCWLSNPNVTKFMKDNNIKDGNELHNYFMQNVLPKLPQKSKPIVWQEVADSDVKLPKDTIVQLWKTEPDPDIVKYLEKGYRVLYSSCWYLDHLESGGDWTKYYNCDPRGISQDIQVATGRERKTPVNESNIIGGEACMWAESVDDTNVISRIWPRASATAEKLWASAPNDSNSKNLPSHMRDSASIPDEVFRRLEEHTCRMRRRGVSAQPPNGPGFCRVA